MGEAAEGALCSGHIWIAGSRLVLSTIELHSTMPGSTVSSQILEEIATAFLAESPCATLVLSNGLTLAPDVHAARTFAEVRYERQSFDALDSAIVRAESMRAASDAHKADRRRTAQSFSMGPSIVTYDADW